MEPRQSFLTFNLAVLKPYILYSSWQTEGTASYWSDRFGGETSIFEGTHHFWSISDLWIHHTESRNNPMISVGLRCQTRCQTDQPGYLGIPKNASSFAVIRWNGKQSTNIWLSERQYSSLWSWLMGSHPYHGGTHFLRSVQLPAASQPRFFRALGKGSADSDGRDGEDCLGDLGRQHHDDRSQLMHKAT